ncbi:hypothetical protein D6810_00670 [Candidatus Dojkabacteria bacterium]|uniref:Uncharacterized protein n=1 Tax=Candidatus Dojkabacteria bacterium TaxID=2099670 RepID=A0A3M0Z1J3_9BACT|nr:MAG: hypothetical protein D6810_00670 [Candidatus Dojkabacteria bacterium]
MRKVFLLLIFYLLTFFIFKNIDWRVLVDPSLESYNQNEKFYTNLIALLSFKEINFYDLHFKLIKSESIDSSVIEEINNEDFRVFNESVLKGNLEVFGAYYDIKRSEKEKKWSDLTTSDKNLKFGSFINRFKSTLEQRNKKIIELLRADKEINYTIFTLVGDVSYSDYSKNIINIKSLFKTFYQAAKFIRKLGLEVDVNSITVPNIRQVEVKVRNCKIRLDIESDINEQTKRLKYILDNYAIEKLSYIDVTTDKMSVTFL